MTNWDWALGAGLRGVRLIFLALDGLKNKVFGKGQEVG